MGALVDAPPRADSNTVVTAARHRRHGRRRRRVVERLRARPRSPRWRWPASRSRRKDDGRAARSASPRSSRPSVDLHRAIAAMSSRQVAARHADPAASMLETANAYGLRRRGADALRHLAGQRQPRDRRTRATSVKPLAHAHRGLRAGAAVARPRRPADAHRPAGDGPQGGAGSTSTAPAPRIAPRASCRSTAARWSGPELGEIDARRAHRRCRCAVLERASTTATSSRCCGIARRRWASARLVAGRHEPARAQPAGAVATMTGQPVATLRANWRAGGAPLPAARRADHRGHDQAARHRRALHRARAARSPSRPSPSRRSASTGSTTC